MEESLWYRTKIAQDMNASTQSVRRRYDSIAAHDMEHLTKVLEANDTFALEKRLNEYSVLFIEDTAEASANQRWSCRNRGRKEDTLKL